MQAKILSLESENILLNEKVDEMIIDKEKRENDLRLINNKLQTYLEDLYPKSTFSNFFFDNSIKQKIGTKGTEESIDSAFNNSKNNMNLRFA